MIVGDPDQNIYTNDLHLPDFGIPPVALTCNCRNTQKIFEALKPYQNTPGVVMQNAPVGSDVRILKGDSRKNLESELERLIVKEGVNPQLIVVLGAHTLSNTSLGDDPKVGRFTLVSTLPPLKKQEIQYFTFMKFKGCEAKVVILLDVDPSDPRWNNRGIYTAMSRAVHQLIILS